MCAAGEGRGGPAGAAVLADGSWMSRIADPAASRRMRRRKAKVPAAQIPGIEVRVIEYTVESEPDEHGNVSASELFCLITTLLDEDAYPMADFPDLYHDRWRIETAIGDVETSLLGGPEVILRSQKPDLVRQEVYGVAVCLPGHPRPDRRRCRARRPGPGPDIVHPRPRGSRASRQ